MVTPYFSEFCHGYTCLLNALYPNCRSKNRGTQSFELLHDGLLTLCSISTIITLVLL
ncbi:unnamed protein product [Callosobruchus maculatus]|uniref:Uncharacterized protein n=1 Tax=Callosobruchus maculatus TaxID=64391 RepID=A0A653CUB7_CALMS|nr:unnamed protein product [Callosobruchus maculatus]